MASTSSTLTTAPPIHAAPQEPLIGEKGLKTNAIGFLSNMVIGVASTAPAYSLAATLGFIVAVGVSASTRPRSSSSRSSRCS